MIASSSKRDKCHRCVQSRLNLGVRRGTEGGLETDSRKNSKGTEAD